MAIYKRGTFADLDALDAVEPMKPAVARLGQAEDMPSTRSFRSSG